MSKNLYLLYESPTGYALFQRLTSASEIAATDLELQKSLSTLNAVQGLVKLVSFAPFTSPENALEDCVCITEGLMSPFLSTFLQSNLPKVGGKSAATWELGVADTKLGSAIHESLKYPIVCNDSIGELCRIIRVHIEALLPDHEAGDIRQAQCGLGHAFSRNKVKFNVHRSDNMIIQASALIEHMDKGVNLLGMRVKEWYGWHFPELAREVAEPLKFAKVALLVQNRATLESQEAEAVKAALQEIVEDEAVAARVYEKAVTSMGGDMADVDWINIQAFAERVVSLAQYRIDLHTYLNAKMMAVAPNLTQLMGQQIGAKLISKAGSLTNLAKAPASTIQILGAEKALFRALKKKKGNTPKYGLIFHSTFIQRAAKEHRGKISRYLANKAALACRIDCFMDQPPEVFGEKLREQVEGRLAFFDSGSKQKSNAQVMTEALEQYYAVLRKRERKRAKAAAYAEVEAQAEAEMPPKKKARKDAAAA